MLSQAQVSTTLRFARNDGWVLLLFLKNFLSEHEQIDNDENDNQDSQSDERLSESLRSKAHQKQHGEA